MKDCLCIRVAGLREYFVLVRQMLFLYEVLLHLVHPRVLSLEYCFLCSAEEDYGGRILRGWHYKNAIINIFTNDGIELED